MQISTPLLKETIRHLHAGDKVLLSGIIYTARDAAHMRLMELINSNLPLPVDLKRQIIYYTGPTPTKPGSIVGSAGPTTSGRMDAFTPQLLDLGLAGMIGKGNRSQAVIDSIIKNEAVYLGCVGGTAALISSYITAARVIAFEDLGAEAIHEFRVENFPLFVAIDSQGNNIYQA